MKALNVVISALGGMLVGASLALLFAPSDGKSTRAKIKDFLREKGINLPQSKLDEIVDEIEAEIKC